MKDMDFDDIGKRLYDLEADPPKNGWKKIGSALKTPHSSEKVVWLRKNWWKPLIILIPVGFYFFYSVREIDGVTKSSSRTDSSIEKTHELENGQHSINDGPSEEKYEITKPELITDNDAHNSPGDEAIQNKATAANENTNDLPGEASAPLQSISSSSNSNAESNKKTELEDSEAIPNPADRLAKDAVTTPDNISHVSKDSGIVIEKEIAGLKTRVNPDDRISSAEGNDALEDSSSKETGLQAIDVVGGTSKEQLPPTLAHEAQGENVSTAIDTPKTEKTKITTLQTKNIKADSVAMTENENKESEKVREKWRVTVSFSPQYVSKTVRPIANDEVLVTGVDRSRDSHKVGFTFAAGAGLAITENFYLDAQVSYAEAQQAIHFSYATGNVDTLIAVKQPDQSVSVTPIYETANREIESKYGYTGLRLGATHYFWSTTQRRFNISAMAGAHYLVSADVKEKRNGNWVALSNEDLNKLNYSLIVSAGYNINLNKGWELMINPSLTYYLRKVKSSELPYDLSQQSLGLNFMLSKSLGK